MLGTVALACVPGLLQAQAQTPPAVFSVDGNLKASDNGGLEAAGLERNEFITSVRPKVVLTRRSAGLTLDLEAAAAFTAYANGTQSDGVFPEARGSLKATLLERWAYLDAAVQVREVEQDPFGSRVDGSNGANRRTERTYRLSPYIQRELAPGTTLLARYDASLTENGAGEGTRLLSQNSLLRLEREPVPIGGALELSRLDNESRDVVTNTYTLDTARLRVNVQLEDQMVVGVVAGADRSQWLLSDNTDALYGVNLKWNPGPRTSLSADLEHRFFGAAGKVEFRHRMPSMSFALTASREPVMASTSLGVVGPGGDLRGFLDAILTTRYPDPAAREGVVDKLVTSRGLDTRVPNAVDLVAEYPQVRTAANLTWAALGTRNTASVTLFARELSVITREGDPLPLPGVAGEDSRQHGAAFQFNHRLTPQLSVDAGVNWSRFRGLEARSGEQSEQTDYRLSFVQSLSPRTGASAGLQHTRFTSNASGQASYDETQVFVGMNHRF
jgi:uncharacterized protein (PEP-CTERM system associated)